MTSNHHPPSLNQSSIDTLLTYLLLYRYERAGLRLAASMDKGDGKEEDGDGGGGRRDREARQKKKQQQQQQQQQQVMRRAVPTIYEKLALTRMF